VEWIRKCDPLLSSVLRSRFQNSITLLIFITALHPSSALHQKTHIRWKTKECKIWL